MKLTRLLVFCLLLASATSAWALPIDFTHFHTPSQIDNEMTNLIAAYPSIAQSITIGNSVQGRTIKGLKISDNVGTDETGEGDVVFVGLHHAREWITAETVLYLAEYLLTHYGKDPALKACMDNLEIWIIPVLNPDGYVYSHTSTSNRCWRKNRRQNPDGTFGVDLNRNYSYYWGGLGSHHQYNSEIYCGPVPLSEPETASFKSFVNALDHPKALLSYHSFSELFLRPWAYTSNDPPGEWILECIADDSIDRMAAVHGHTYGATSYYVSAGTTRDCFWAELRLATFTPELRPIPKASQSCNSPGSPNCGGFSPPPSQIIPCAQENVPAAVALIRDAGCRKLWIKDHPADTGVEPSAVWTGSGWSHAFWTSPDIWCVPDPPLAGSEATLKVRVHNDSGAPIKNAVVRAYWNDPGVTMEIPTANSTLIGSKTVTLPPGDKTVSFKWAVPSGINSMGHYNWCVGALVAHPDDRPLTIDARRTSNMAIRNIQTTTITKSALLGVAVNNLFDVAAEYRVYVDPETLPRGWEVIIPPLPPRPGPNPKARLLGVTGNVLEPGETVVQLLRVQIPDWVKPGTRADIHVHGILVPLVPGDREKLATGGGYTFRVRVAREEHSEKRRQSELTKQSE